MMTPVTASVIWLRRRLKQPPPALRRLCNIPSSAMVSDAAWRGAVEEEGERENTVWWSFQHRGQCETEAAESKSPPYVDNFHLPPVNYPAVFPGFCLVFSQQLPVTQ